MQSFKTPLIIFAITLLVLVGGVLLIGNPEGTTEVAALSGVEDVIADLELNPDEIKACIESGEFNDRVDKDIKTGNELAVTGTPAVFFLNIETGNSVVARGSYPLEPLKATVNGLLAEDVKVGDVVYEDSEQNVKLVVEKFENLDLNEEDHLRGSQTARIAMIEYSDLECQYCARFHGTAFQLLNEFPEDLVWAFRHFPLVSIHPSAKTKAMVIECAQKLGGAEAFWALVDTYYINFLN